MDFPSGYSLMAISLSWSIDLVAIIALIALATFSTVQAGTNRTTALALTFPFSLLLYSELPASFLLGDVLVQITSPLAHVAIFGILFVIVLIAVFRIISSYDSFSGSPLLGALTGLAIVILLLTTWLQIPALSELHTLSAPLPTIFAEGYRFWWTLGALGLLAYVRS
ncbi:MAG: hypothetical protein Q8R25_03175 [bacterium]|nr:hypothetical protein [bacterium]